MRHSYHWLFLLGIFAAGGVHAQEETPPVAPPQIQQAEALIERGKSGEAYALLEPLEPALAGDIRYDYLIGISAVNSGKASLAVFALERVQATDPQYRDIGLWLSIAYYQSGDRERAKAGFDAVVAQSQNAEARAKAARYLAAMGEEETARHGKPSLLGKVDIGVGHDNNITNSSPGYASAPQLAAAVPTPASNRAGMESILGLGVEGRIPIAGHYAFASADDEKRRYNGHSVMNSDTLVAKGGMNFANDGDTYKINVAQRQFRQQGTFFAAIGVANDYNISGVETGARLKLSARDYLGLVAQYNQLRFLANNTEDTNQVMLGANYLHVFQTSGTPVFYLGYARLDDQAVRVKTAYNPAYADGTTVASRGTDIFTLYLQYSASKDVDIVSTDYVYYRQDTGAFARDAVVDYGRDKTNFLSLGINWRFKPQWTARSLLAKTSNNSNIALYSYNKTEGTVILRREFD